jgi:glycosyltransferase involved in cell wall biosynthesis
MLAGEDIIYLSCGYWDSPLITHQQVALRLARENRLLFVEPSISYLPFRYPERWVKWVDWVRSTRHLEKHLYLCTSPPLPPFKGSSLVVNHLSQMLTARYVQGRVKELEFRDPILWLFSPLYVEMVGKFGEKFVIYHCIDEFTAAPWYKQDVIEKMERQLLTMADLVITCSDSIYERKRGFCRNIINVPNGCDFKLYNQALSAELAVPEEIANVRKPVVGFSGVMDFRFEADLLYHVAKSLPDFSFILIGPDRIGLKQLRSLKNVHKLGMKLPQSLPSYIKAFDVCIIPYHLNEFVLNISPTKLHEYFATGKPIVTTDIPATREFAEVLYIARSYDEFVENLRLAVNENNNFLVEKRVEIARQNSWGERVETISDQVEKLLNLTTKK